MLAARAQVRLVLGAISAAVLFIPASRADVVLDWNEVLLDAVRVDRSNPPRASRAMAMVHVAIFNAMNAIDPRFDAYGDFSFPASPMAGSTSSDSPL